jgi:hypothetical protein
LDPTTVVETFKLHVNGDEYVGKPGTPDSTTKEVTYTFENVIIDESSDVKFLVDIKPAITNTPKFTVKNAFDRSAMELTEAVTAKKYV